jgi:aspartate/methionine/tyrosine aminotransferase
MEVVHNMSKSTTKTSIIQQHETNKLLQAPTLSPLQRPGQNDLSADHPTRQPYDAMIENAAEALEQGQTHYVDVPGIMPLREALAAYLKTLGLADYEQDNVLVTAGIQECRFLSVQIIGEAFGCIALPEAVHPGVLKAAGVRRIEVSSLPVDEENGLLPTLKGMRAALESGCSLLYLESPARLTGAVFDAVAVTEIAGMVAEFDAAVIWDQGLAPWVHGPPYVSLGSKPGMAARVAVLGEAWPGIGLESWFIGYVAANAEWFESMRSQKQIISICTSTPSQFAALKAAELYADVHQAQVDEFAQAHQKALALVRRLGAMSLPGSTANLIAVKPSDLERTREALRQGGFLFADGADFGAQGVLRFSVTSDDTSEEALQLLA